MTDTSNTHGMGWRNGNKGRKNEKDVWFLDCPGAVAEHESGGSASDFGKEGKR